MLTTMEANGQDVMAELDRLEVGSNEKAAATKAAKREQQLAATSTAAATEDGAEVAPPSIPPSLNQYLFDSFQNYDTDKSGTLDMSEFWPFISSIFSHNFTDDDLEALQVVHVRYVMVRFCNGSFTSHRGRSILTATAWSRGMKLWQCSRRR